MQIGRAYRFWLENRTRVQMMTGDSVKKDPLLTHTYRDFEELHNLVVSAQGHHLGIIVIRRDDKRQRNLAPHNVVRALSKLEAAGIPIADQYITLNQWQ